MSPAERRDDRLERAFAEILRKLRRRQGLSQEQLAFACNISREYVSLLERGQHLPSIRTLIALATALEVSPSEMFRRFERELHRR